MGKERGEERDNGVGGKEWLTMLGLGHADAVRNKETQSSRSEGVIVAKYRCRESCSGPNRIQRDLHDR